MAAPAVGAALKKIATYILTDKKALKAVGLIVGIVLVVILLPIGALLAIFNGGIEIDTNRINEIYAERMTEIVEVWESVETGMSDAGFDQSRIDEAQALFIFGLEDHIQSDDFADKFVGCFADEQSDEELISAINSKFGTDITVTDFQNAMASTRNAYVDTSDYTDPTTKNNIDLVKWAEFAADNGWGYVYGTYGSILSPSLLESKVTQYPDEVGGKQDFIREHWLGKRTADCVGLIKGYAWFDVATQNTILVSNGMADLGADGMYNAATEKGTIDTIPEIPGLAVWKEGHIGIYIGGGYVIEAYGTEQGVIRSVLADGGWTHWIKIPSLNYIEE